MKILAIETSCDETSIAVMRFNADGSFKLLSNIVSSQVKIHAPFGGVVPMLAKREHQKNLTLILKQSLFEAGLLQVKSSELKVKGYSEKFKVLKEILERESKLLKKLTLFLKKYQKPNIDLIAATNGPGLEPALWVGVNFAKTLGYFWNLPIVPVNHVEAHIIANWLQNSTTQSLNHSITQKTFPAISLIVSGGHTQLILMKDFGRYKILGETRDDAAGEAFDKLAKMLNLGYPGGPIVAACAAKLKVKSEKLKVKLPRPMINSKDYDFSFSGLKTAALYFVKTLDKTTIKKLMPAICAEFQQAAIDVLIFKTIRAAKEFDAKTILLSGGVAANDLLRETLKRATYSLSEVERSKINFCVPPKEFCTDNAAMIALTACFKIQKSKVKSQSTSWRTKFKDLNWQKIKVDANSRIS